MIDYCETEPREELEKSPWLIPSSLLRPSCESERDLMDWFCQVAPTNSGSVGYAVYELYDSPAVRVAVLPDVGGDEKTFKMLVEVWKEETWFISSIKKRIAHPAYLKIIGLGRNAIPWILEELRTEPDYWYAALEAITRTDPAPHAENMHQMLEAWLAWGKANGY